MQYTIPPIEVVKITVSIWAHTGANPDGSVGRDLPGLRLFDSSGSLSNQPNNFDFYPSGYVSGLNDKRNFLETVVSKDGTSAAVITDLDSIPNDRWTYTSTTYDGTTGIREIFQKKWFPEKEKMSVLALIVPCTVLYAIHGKACSKSPKNT